LFNGWFTALSGGTQITTSYVFTINTTIYAQWTQTGSSYIPPSYSYTDASLSYSYTDASLSISSVTFNKSNAADINITLSSGSYGFRNIKNGSYTLVQGTDYTVSGNTYTIKAQYLASLSNGTHTVVFEMNGGTNPSVAITITGTTPASTVPGTVNGKQAEFTKNADGSVLLRLAASDMANFPAANNIFAIEIKDQKAVSVSLSIASLGNASVLQIKTDSGTVVFTKKMLEAYKSIHGDIIEIYVSSGSLTVELLKNGKAINYNDPDNPFTVILPYTLTSGQRADSVIAVKKDGSKTTILPLGVYRNGNMTFNVSSTGTYDVVYNTKSFIDITNHWAYNNIMFIAAREITLGNNAEGTMFDPNAEVTRAMFATFIARVEGVDTSKNNITSTFGDVKSGEWYTAAIEWAFKAGITNGTSLEPGNMQFDPNTVITHEQMVTMLNRYLDYKKYGLTSATDTGTVKYTDMSNLNDWAVDAVKKFADKQILNSRADGTGFAFDPTQKTTRAEMVAVLARVISSID
jgi:hypothetical protein